MKAIAWIVERLNDICSYFYDLYLEFYDFPPPISYAATWLYWLSREFSNLAWSFYDFYFWVEEVSKQVSLILSWSTIWSYIKDRVPNLEQISDWFSTWRTKVRLEVSAWWSDAGLVVLSWIAEAERGLLSRIESIQNVVNSLRGEWNSFKPQLPAIESLLTWYENWRSNVRASFDAFWREKLLDIQRLIDDAFTLRAYLWSDWLEHRDNILEFISDPLQWLYDRIDEFAERFW